MKTLPKTCKNEALAKLYCVTVHLFLGKCSLLLIRSSSNKVLVSNSFHVFVVTLFLIEITSN